jgi:mRNA interferase HigB
MRIISFKKLREFVETDPNARVAMQDWYKRTSKANWDNFSDVKNTFNATDSGGNTRFVFDVKGNHYRIVAKIAFNIKTVFIRWVGNHNDYVKLKNIDKL